MIAVVANSKGDRTLTNRIKANRLTVQLPSPVRSYIMALTTDEYIDDVQICENAIFVVSHDKEEVGHTPWLWGRIFTPVIHRNDIDWKMEVSANDDPYIDMGLLSENLAELRQIDAELDDTIEEVKELKKDSRKLWKKLHYSSKQ